MKIFIYVLLFFCSFSNKIRAQENFIEGSLINKKNETFFGFIRIQENDSLIICSFMNHLNSIPVRYSPSEIKEFRYKDGRKFVSNRFGINIDTTRVQFVEHLVSGGANLYFVNKIYYLIKQDNIAVVLNYDQVVNKENTPQGQGLTFLLSDCIGFIKSANKVVYSHEYLIKTIKKYNSTCYDILVEDYFSKKHRPISIIEAKIGSSFTDLISTDGTSLGIVPNLTYGINYRFVFPYFKNRLDWQIGLYSYRQNAIIYRNVNIENGGDLYQEYKFDNTFMMINSQLGYSVIKSKVEVGLAFGLSYFIPLKNNSSIISEVYRDNVVTTNIECLSSGFVLTSSFGINMDYNLRQKGIFGLDLGLDVPLTNENNGFMKIFIISVSYGLILGKH